jgi:CRP/FNR family transcriptional regulator, cyclic AMP receptor protein
VLQVRTHVHQVRRRSAPSGVRVLEEDPDLGLGIDPNEWALASAAAIAPVFTFDRGPWRFFPPPDHASFGALILSGIVVVRIDAATRAHIELLGQGDVMSPWVGGGEDLAIPSEVNASVATLVRIALLDQAFARRTARWPEIHAALMQRLILRTRRLSLQAAINGVPRIEERVELTLWELAYRFGRVTPGGIMLELPITHSQLAEILAAQRPSVSIALGRLQAHGRVVRENRHRWLLSGEPPPLLHSLARQSGLRV